jgi:hypothetical protein
MNRNYVIGKPINLKISIQRMKASRFTCDSIFCRNRCIMQSHICLCMINRIHVANFCNSQTDSNHLSLLFESSFPSIHSTYWDQNF